MRARRALGGDRPERRVPRAADVVGAWPLDARARSTRYLEKALREGKRTTNWLEPDEAAEQRVKDFAARCSRERRRSSAFVERVRPLGEQISLGMLALKLTSPGRARTSTRATSSRRSRSSTPTTAGRSTGTRAARALDDPPPKLALILRAPRCAAARRTDYEPLDRGPGRRRLPPRRGDRRGAGARVGRPRRLCLCRRWQSPPGDRHRLADRRARERPDASSCSRRCAPALERQGAVMGDDRARTSS